METHAYNESYLPKAMETLAIMMDCGINRCGFTPDSFYHMFIASGIAEQFEKGNPKFIAGMSGAELADQVVFKIMREEIPSNDGRFTISPEYWAGWVLAYYQWKSEKSFRYLRNNGLDIGKVITLYYPLHEADLEKFADVADEIILNHVKTSTNPIKIARVRLGITQKELARKADVSLRMIRAYEQNKQSLSNANFITVSSLASALHIDAKDILP